MTSFQITGSLLTLAALFSYLNHRLLRLPLMVALMLLSLLLSLVLVVVGRSQPGVLQLASRVMTSVDFNRTLLHGMLGYLLFAGALHVDLEVLRRQRLVIAVLATVGVLLSTAIVGGLVWLVLGFTGLQIGLGPCLLFGALISPTDPISVLATLKSLGAPRELEVQIAGESLFNDGVGVVAFTTLLAYYGLTPGAYGHGASLLGAVGTFLFQVGGGALFGWACAWLFLRMVRDVHDAHLEVLLSLALVSGGFALADALGVSAPIAMVVAGLMVGSRAAAGHVEGESGLALASFWDFIDEILNAVLFVLIGLQVLVLAPHPQFLLAGLLAVPIVLAARTISVAVPISIMGRRRLVPHGVTMMVWGGLRGGLSVAMALALRSLLAGQPGIASEVVLSMTYVVVAFSIVVQGTTIHPVARRLVSAGRAMPPA
jgi:monovalent cation:H+ antiporter, CPA1 family